MKKHERNTGEIPAEAEALKAWRARLDINQDQAGELLGVDTRTIKRWEVNGPQLPLITALACTHLERSRKG